MNIGIIGSFSSASIGDHYILDGMINQFKSVLGDNISFLIFSPSPESTKNISIHNIETIAKTPFNEDTSNSKEITFENDTSFRSTIRNMVKELFDTHPNLWFTFDPIAIGNLDFWREHYDRIKELDLLIHGGGNIVMDLYPVGCIYHLIYSKLAELADIPFMYYAIGAGPLRSFRGKYYLKKSIKDSFGITTRDTESLQLLENKLGLDLPHGSVSADPAVYLENKATHESQLEITYEEADYDINIGVSLVPYYMEGYWPVADQKIYNDYIETISVIIGKFLKKNSASATFFATNHPGDLQPAQEVINKIDLNGQTSICRQRLNSEKIFSFLNQLNFIFCTRLHSLIPTFVSNTPFVAFSYQPKVQNFCRRIGLEEQSINLENSPSAIVAQSGLAVNNALSWGESIPDHNAKLKDLRESASLSTEVAKDALSNKNSY